MNQQDVSLDKNYPRNQRRLDRKRGRRMTILRIGITTNKYEKWCLFTISPIHVDSCVQSIKPGLEEGITQENIGRGFAVRRGAIAIGASASHPGPYNNMVEIWRRRPLTTLEPLERGL